MTPEIFIKNSAEIVAIFGHFPPFHDAHVNTLCLEVSVDGFYPKITLCMMVPYQKVWYEIVLKFSNVLEVSLDNFGNQNSIFEMNFEYQDKKICCVIEPNCGLSSEIISQDVEVLWVKKAGENFNDYRQ